MTKKNPTSNLVEKKIPEETIEITIKVLILSRSFLDILIFLMMIFSWLWKEFIMIITITVRWLFWINCKQIELIFNEHFDCRIWPLSSLPFISIIYNDVNIFFSHLKIYINRSHVNTITVKTKQNKKTFNHCLIQLKNHDKRCDLGLNHHRHHHNSLYLSIITATTTNGDV